ncbi:MAG: sulfatase-like hydrolase/transferase [Terrimicrobiaceae bacterium]
MLTNLSKYSFRSAPRVIMRILLVLLCASKMALCGDGGTPQPNILFLVVDDLKTALGCYGDKTALTPNIDKFASTGTVFLRNYCQAAHCNPSRASMMTELRPDAAGVTEANDPYFRDTIPDVTTLHGPALETLGKVKSGFPKAGRAGGLNPFGYRNWWNRGPAR